MLHINKRSWYMSVRFCVSGLLLMFFSCSTCGELAGYLQEYIQSRDHRYNVSSIECNTGLTTDTCMYICVYLCLFSLNRLPPSSESKLQLLYKRSVRSCSDPFKKAVYCLLARCEIMDNHPEVCVKTEDYMWLKVHYMYV